MRGGRRRKRRRKNRGEVEMGAGWADGGRGRVR